MTVKELYKKYKNYNILLFGRPLENKTIPFTFLPYDKKELNEMIVEDMKIEEKPFHSPRWSFPDLKYKGEDYYKGTIMAYCVKFK